MIIHLNVVYGNLFSQEWPPYAANIVRFCPLPCGHYPAEQAPDELCNELLTFFKS